MSEAGQPAFASVLCFCAGSLHLGIAARDVMSVQSSQDTAVHIATIFGLPPAGAKQRTIHLAPMREGERAGVAFNADLPMEVIHCHSSDILPLPAGIASERWRPVMGFFRQSRRLVLLLDIPSVIAKLMEITRGEML